MLETPNDIYDMHIESQVLGHHGLVTYDLRVSWPDIDQKPDTSNARTNVNILIWGQLVYGIGRLNGRT